MLPLTKSVLNFAFHIKTNRSTTGATDRTATPIDHLVTNRLHKFASWE